MWCCKLIASWWITLLVVASCEATVTDEEYAIIPDVFYQDNFDKCMLRKEKANFCSFDYKLEPIDHDKPPDMWRIITEISNKSTNYRHDILRHSICVPKTCPNVPKLPEDHPELWRAIQDCYDAIYKPLGFKGTILKVFCETQDPKFPIDWLDITFGILFSAYVLFVFYASFYEGFKRYETIEVYNKWASTKSGNIFCTFSITRNWIRLKTINSTHEIERLRCIQGMRLYNTCLVVLSHTALSLIGGPVANLDYPESLHQNVARLIFSSGPLCVGTFFLFSTFLMSNSMFDHLENKKMNLKLIFFIIGNRIFRLTPTMLVVVLFHATWLRHLGTGPWWNQFVGYEYQKCRVNGWTNLVYINNWYDLFSMCLPVTWYLALDTQYFILALFFIWFLKSNEKYFYWIIGMTLSIIFVATFMQNYYYDFSGLILPVPEYFFGIRNLLGSFQFHYQIGSFIGNLSPAVFGVAVGYYFHKHKNDSPDQYIFRTKFRQTLWWLFTFIAALLYLIIPGSMILNYDSVHDRFWASIYVAVSRPLFGFIIGLGVIGFTEGIGWLALRVINWPPTYILARLTFSVYLIHMSFNLITPAILRYSAYVNNYVTLVKFLGDIFFIYIIATLLALFVELPVSQLQKMVFKLPDSKKNTEKNN